MIFIGDVHGEFEMYHGRILQFDRSIQVGDMGIGFGADEQYKKLIMPRHKFIRGNHDCPQKCRNLPQYLGEFGYLEDDEIFFVSGAYSIDQEMRTPHVDWWDEEELSARQMNQAVCAYRKIRPKIVVTHDCPFSVYDVIYSIRRRQSSMTARMFATMFAEHRPRAWVFGHHHRSCRFEREGTSFFGLAMLEVIDLKEVECVS